MDWTLASQSSVGGKRSISSDPGGDRTGQQLTSRADSSDTLLHLPFAFLVTQLTLS